MRSLKLIYTGSQALAEVLVAVFGMFTALIEQLLDIVAQLPQSRNLVVINRLDALQLGVQFRQPFTKLLLVHVNLGHSGPLPRNAPSQRPDLETYVDRRRRMGDRPD